MSETKSNINLRKIFSRTAIIGGGICVVGGIINHATINDPTITDIALKGVFASAVMSLADQFVPKSVGRPKPKKNNSKFFKDNDGPCGDCHCG